MFIILSKSMSKTVTIDRDELRNLLKRDEKLTALENLGVDNWIGYSMQWDEEEIGFKRIGNDNEAWDNFIEATYGK